MSIFEEFAAFAEALPEDRRAVAAELVSSIMAAEGEAANGDWELSGERLRLNAPYFAAMTGCRFRHA